MWSYFDKIFFAYIISRVIFFVLIDVAVLAGVSCILCLSERTRTTHVFIL